MKNKTNPIQKREKYFVLSEVLEELWNKNYGKCVLILSMPFLF